MKFRRPAPQSGRRSRISGRRERDDEDRPAAAPLGHVVDEVERPLVGPVEVLEHEHDRALGRDPLEERPPGGEQLLAGERRRPVDAEQDEQRATRSSGAPSRRSPSGRRSRRASARVVASSSVSARPARLRTISPSAQNVIPSPYAGERPVCHQTVSTTPSRYFDSSHSRRLLPDPATPMSGHHAGPLLLARAVDEVLEQPELAVPARRAAPRAGRRARGRRARPPRGSRGTPAPGPSCP